MDLSSVPIDSFPAGHEHDGIYPHLLAILARTAAIDNEKRRFALECDQGMMPSIAAIIHALAARTQEHPNAACIGHRTIGGDDHQEWPCLQRIEGLTGHRVSLEREDSQGQRTRARFEDAEQRPAVGFTDVDLRQIVEAAACLLIDPTRVPTRGLDHIAERGEPIGRQLCRS